MVQRGKILGGETMKAKLNTEYILSWRWLSEVSGKPFRTSHVGLKIDGKTIRIALARGISKGDRELRSLYSSGEPVEIVLKGFTRSIKDPIKEDPAITYMIKNAKPVSYELVGGVIANRDLSDPFAGEAEYWIRSPGFDMVQNSVVIDRVVLVSKDWEM
jgi:hypothetical protein